MGSENSVAIPGDSETPLRPVEIKTPFWIDQSETTVLDFNRFVTSTNYTTTAENFGNSFVFWLELQDLSKKNVKLQENASRVWWWIQKDGISFRNVTKESAGDSVDNYPATHVSWDDAQAYCDWKGGRLPTEEEWEFACKGGCDRCIHQWGDELKLNGTHM